MTLVPVNMTVHTDREITSKSPELSGHSFSAASLYPLSFPLTYQLLFSNCHTCGPFHVLCTGQDSGPWARMLQYVLDCFVRDDYYAWLSSGPNTCQFTKNQIRGSSSYASLCS